MLLPLGGGGGGGGPCSRKHELPGIAEWMIEQKHKRIYAEDVLRLNDEARSQEETAPQLMTVAL